MYALLPDKKDKTYSPLLAAIKQTIPEICPATFKVDYEMGLTNTLKSSCPAVKFIGCNFLFQRYNQK